MFLGDTNVLSELARQQVDLGVATWASEVTEIAISVVTVEEISYGLAAKPNLRVQTWFKQLLESNCRVLPISFEISNRSGELRGMLRLSGKVRSQADMLIAATAQIHQLTLVTRNIRDFEGCGIPLLNPFRE
jgi:predicted nucleic acid-binding protein